MTKTSSPILVFSEFAILIAGKSDSFVINLINAISAA
jgi:hypothetical protein